MQQSQRGSAGRVCSSEVTRLLPQGGHWLVACPALEGAMGSVADVRLGNRGGGPHLLTGQPWTDQGLSIPSWPREKEPDGIIMGRSDRGMMGWRLGDRLLQARRDVLRRSEHSTACETAEGKGCPPTAGSRWLSRDTGRPQPGRHRGPSRVSRPGLPQGDRVEVTPHPACPPSLLLRVPAPESGDPTILGLRSSGSGQSKESGQTVDVEEGSGLGEETIRSSGGRLFWAVGEDGGLQELCLKQDVRLLSQGEQLAYPEL